MTTPHPSRRPARHGLAWIQPAGLLLASAWLLAGCGAMQAAKNLVKATVYPTVENLKITTQADAVINADDRGAALPVTVRVYQLSDATQLQQADYAALLEHDQQVLGTGLLKRYEYVSYPQSTTVQEFPIQPDARFIAVLAVMRKPPAPAYFLWNTRTIDGSGISFNIGAQNMRLVEGPAPLNKGNENAPGLPAAAPAATSPPVPLQLPDPAAPRPSAPSTGSPSPTSDKA